jgi:hypothetical protein
MMLKAVIAVLGAMMSMTLADLASAQEVTLKWTKKDGSVVEKRVLDLAAIDSLPQREIVTTTPWTQGQKRFSGAAMADLSALFDHPVEKARLTALNDYAITIPAEDWRKYVVILASRQDGAIMRIRDKGPFWVIYPLDTDPKLRNPFYHSRMIWQVREIVFVSD